MKDEGFHEEGEAVGKWKRACLTYTEPSTYIVVAGFTLLLAFATFAQWT